MDSVGGAIFAGGKKKKNVIKCGRIVFYSTWFLKTLWSAATNLSGYKCGKSPPIILPLTRSINGPSLPTANTGLSALHRIPPIPALSFLYKASSHLAQEALLLEMWKYSISISIVHPSLSVAK